MGSFIAALLALLPNVLIAVFAKLLTQSFLQDVLERVILYSLSHAVKLTTNTLDDEIYREIEARLKGGGNAS